MLICGLRALQNDTFWLIHIYVSLSVKQVGALEIKLSFVTKLHLAKQELAVTAKLCTSHKR